MSCEELERNEKSVQLTPEDIQLLSEYSWDMAEYTSRFGYFYLSSVRENVKGLTKWQAEHIYQLTPIPPGMEDPLQDMENSSRIDKEKQKELQKQNEAVADDYLVQALKEKELRYLSFFLHGYEHKLNGKVYSFLRRNGMDTYDPALFLDMKLALQELILKKLPTFDPTRDAKFLTYLHYFIYDTFKTFRMQQECWTIDSLDIYKSIRRMVAIYNANSHDKKKAIEIFCEQTGYTQKIAEAYLAEAVGIRARQTEVVIDRNEDDVATVEDIIPAGKGSLHRIVCNHWRGLAIRESLEKLPWRDRKILEARNAICSNCGGMLPIKERFSFQEIGTRIMNGATDKGAEVAYCAALKQLMLQMIEDHPIRVVDLKCKKIVRRKKKIAAATYLYQADCDGKWGEVYIDFENKYIKIKRLAEWDTTVSHIYAWKVIGFIVANKDRILPKKRRIIFEKFHK